MSYCTSIGSALQVYKTKRHSWLDESPTGHPDPSIKIIRVIYATMAGVQTGRFIAKYFVNDVDRPDIENNSHHIGSENSFRQIGHNRLQPEYARDILSISTRASSNDS